MMFGTPNRQSAAAPQAAPQQIAPIGGAIAGRGAAPGGIFNLQGARKFGNSNPFMSAGTYWCLVNKCYQGANRQNVGNANVDMTVVNVLDPDFSGNQAMVPPLRPNKVGEQVKWTISQSSDYFGGKLIAFIEVVSGQNLEGVDAQTQAQVSGSIFGQDNAAENTVIEVKSTVVSTKGQRGPIKDIVVQNFVRRVPWQEVQMLLSKEEQARFFGGRLDAMSASEQQAGLIVPGWQPGCFGTGAGNTAAAQQAAVGVTAMAGAYAGQHAPAHQPQPSATYLPGQQPAATAPAAPPAAAAPTFQPPWRR